MNEKIWWYLSRSSGIVALALLVASVVWGVLLATRVLKPHDRPAWLLDLHRWLGGAALAMTALHLLGLALDGYVDFGFAELFLPGASAYRPLAVAVGILSLYLMVAIQVSSYMRRRIPARVWRGIHVSSYAVVWAGLIHAGMAGTDTVNRVYQATAIALTLAAASAAVVRITSPATKRRTT